MRILLVIACVIAAGLVACSGSDDGSTKGSADGPLVIGGIPDQNVSLLEERFGGLADYLSDALGIDVEYRPATSYATLVTAFQNGDVQLAWFGGLTGVQARLATPGAMAIVQRPSDSEFRSVFIAGAGVDVSTLEDLAGKSFTFGSESSTSGHLMPRYFLSQVGIDPEEDFLGPPSYSGSHDKTWKLVESGSFDAGVLNDAVWNRAVEDGEVDLSKVPAVLLTDPYYDYHWVLHPDIDADFGVGVADKINDALLAMSTSDPEQQKILDLFETDSFVPTENSNYDAIEQIARQLDLIR